MSWLLVLAVISASIWAYLLLGHGGFWQASEWLSWRRPSLPEWPEVVAIIPARNEADVIEATITCHMKCRYPGKFSVLLVDDDSTDGTADKALAAAEAAGNTRALEIVSAPPLGDGWSGKVAAQNAGFEATKDFAPGAKYLLLTDADILHGENVIAKLVAKADTENRALVSLMARLDGRGLWGGLLVPAFVFFFQKLYPFPRVNDRSAELAGAAGGCMLVQRDAFEATGGFEAMRTALIDDCTLAAQVKGRPPQRAIWLGLTKEVTSQRDNRQLTSIWSMVARSAYTQLDYSPLKLAGTVIGMGVVYLAGPLIVLTYLCHGNEWAVLFGLIAWLGMVTAYAPTLILYGQSILNGFALPLAAFFYSLMTLSSAIQHHKGKGGEWKGRTYSGLEGR